MHGKGTIDQSTIEQCKAKLPNATLFKKAWKTSKGTDDYLCRCIDQILLDNIEKRLESNGKGIPLDESNQIIYDYCVLWPVLTDNEKKTLPIGVVPSLVKVIQERSGFVDITITGQVIGPDVSSTIIKEFAPWGDIQEDDLLEIMQTPFELHRVKIGKYVFVIRPLTRPDIVIAQSANDRHISYAKSVTMWPKTVDWNTIPAGILDTLGQSANQVSGWDREAEVEDV